LPNEAASLTEIVQAWRKHWPHTIALPHPSPRNNLWLKRNPWFEKELVPLLQARVSEILERDG
ncbi:MAG: uracil-DNA glycosylase family protein, partial [Nevskiales bacterium]|nr:uracil-DNA glycosylase family protein [Nevskiales bacterium]